MEVSRRNGETVLQVLAKQDLVIQEQQKRIDLLNTGVANLTQRLAEVETMLIIQKVKAMGTGSSVNI